MDFNTDEAFSLVGSWIENNLKLISRLPFIGGSVTIVAFFVIKLEDI